MSGTYHDYRALVCQLLPLANDLTINKYCRIYELSRELSREILFSNEPTGMHHKLLHHFMQALSHNGDHGCTRNTLQ
jgi:hypothetical protein